MNREQQGRPWPTLPATLADRLEAADARQFREAKARGDVAQGVVAAAAIAKGLLPLPERKKGRFFRRGQWRLCHGCKEMFFAPCKDNVHVRQDEGRCSCRDSECERCFSGRSAVAAARQPRRIVLRRRNGEIARIV